MLVNSKLTITHEALCHVRKLCLSFLHVAS